MNPRTYMRPYQLTRIGPRLIRIGLISTFILAPFPSVQSSILLLILFFFVFLLIILIRLFFFLFFLFSSFARFGPQVDLFQTVIPEIIDHFVKEEGQRNEIFVG